MINRLPKPISPQFHRYFDMLALPGLFGLATWLSKRNTPAATVVLTNAVIEGTVQLVTDYTRGVTPRGGLQWITLKDHLRITSTCGVFLALLAVRMGGLRRQDRATILALAMSALSLAALSDPGDADRPSQPS